MIDNTNESVILKQIDRLEREVVLLKRNILRNMSFKEHDEKPKDSLFGAVKAGDVTEEMIEESKQNLFRNLNDI